MKTTFKYCTGTFVLCLSAQILFAQPAANPTLNIPEAIVPGTPPVVDYPGLVNMPGNGKFNYIRTQIPDVPSSTPPTISSYNRINTDYFDGLGRPVQSVARKAHADGNDIVNVHVYDNLGRETYQYLPYAAPLSGAVVLSMPGNIKLNCNTQLRGFYDHAGPDEQPYSKTEYDNSPLNRVTKQLAPGRSWVGSGRGSQFEYRGNNVAEGVRIFTIGNASTDMPASTTAYAANELLVTKTTDEDGKYALEYKDKAGRLILKKNYESGAGQSHAGFACTYYVYDDMDHLRYVIPPKAVQAIDGTWNAASVPELCFSYFYDTRGRMVEKKIPGKAVEYFIYDKRDRQVMYQDGKLRGQYKWLFTLYDALNRPTVTGLSSGSLGRVATQAYIYNTTNYPNTTLMYYIKNYDLYQVYPPSITGADFYSYTYYDNYDQLQNFAYDANQFNNITLPPNGTVVPSVQGTSVQGMVTGSKVRVMDPDSPTASNWLKSVNYYDDKGRLIQSQSENHRGGLDISSNIYYFQGMIWKNIMRHQNPTSLPVPGVTDGAINDIIVVKTFERNLASGGGSGQVYRVTQKIGNGNTYNLAYYDYDHLGRSTVKQFTAANVLQEYNIRGFLNHIQVANFNNDPATNQLEPHIFEENLYYDKGFGSKLYNGNIAGITWKKAGSQAPIEAYGYSYDNLNRLNHAEYRRTPYNTTNWDNTAYNYTASNITYDLNGNIQSMNQQGLNPGVINTPIPMDQLSYTYAANSNKVVKVADGVAPGATVSLPDFKDNANLATEYTYDVNGNMITDANKRITAITYSYLNKPQKITVQDSGTITYVYDATGNRLQKKIFSTLTNKTQVYDYIGNFVYKDSILQYILNEEGRTRPIPVAVPDPNNPGFTTKFVYDYFIKDHLGNVRSNVTAEPINGEYRASHEVVSANIEQLFFDNMPNVRANKPGSIAIDDAMAARLNGNDPSKRIGTAIMLKTMPGDRFNISVDAFYEGEHIQSDDVSTEDVISSLLGTLTGGADYAGTPIRELPDNMRTVTMALGNPQLTGQLDNLINSNNNVNAPKAHLNYLFFNDKMELVPGNSGSVQVPSNISGWTAISPLSPNGTGTQTWVGPNGPGFLLVYIDNQSIGKDVWFDNLMIGMYTGIVKEENHYYPFGLTIATAENQNVTKNPLKLTTKELESSLGLGMYDFGARTYDMTGPVWGQIDPHAEKYYSISPYAYCGNNPVKYMDVDGRDYALAVNHDTRTITVKATYYTASGNTNDYNSANKATQLWNDQSGKYSYTVGKGQEAISYTVNFDLNVQAVDNPQQQLNLDHGEFAKAEDKLVSDNSSNTFGILPDDDPNFTNNNEGQSTNGITRSGVVIKVKESRKDADDTGAHEVGHTLGLGHYSKNLMTPASNDPARSATINKANVQGIIKNAVNGSNTDAGKGHLNQTGTAPDNFSKGKVKEVEQ